MIKIERIENIVRTMCFFSYNTETQGILPAKAGINAVLVILPSPLKTLHNQIT